MTQIAKALGRVMMTAVSSLSQANTKRHADVQRWVETEYRNDPNYAYQCLIHGIKPNMR